MEISALTKAQTELKAPKSQRNRFGGFNYRSAEDILEAVKPINLKYGIELTLSDEIVAVNDRVYIKATATAKYDGTETVVTAFAREAESRKGMDDSQVTGSTSSYARKYALNGLYLIDDNKDADTDEHTKQRMEAKQPVKQEVVKEQQPEEVEEVPTEQPVRRERRRVRRER